MRDFYVILEWETESGTGDTQFLSHCSSMAEARQKALDTFKITHAPFGYKLRN